MSTHKEQLQDLREKLSELEHVIKLAEVADGGKFLPPYFKESGARNARMLISQKLGEMHRQSIQNIESHRDK